MIEGEVTNLSQKKAALEADISVLEERQTKFNEFEENLNQRGITLELGENIAATDADNRIELVKRTRTAAESEAEDKKLAEKKLEVPEPRS